MNDTGLYLFWAMLALFIGSAGVASILDGNNYGWIWAITGTGVFFLFIVVAIINFLMEDDRHES